MNTPVSIKNITLEYISFTYVYTTEIHVWVLWAGSGEFSLGSDYLAPDDSKVVAATRIKVLSIYPGEPFTNPQVRLRIDLNYFTKEKMHTQRIGWHEPRLHTQNVLYH